MRGPREGMGPSRQHLMCHHGRRDSAFNDDRAALEQESVQSDLMNVLLGSALMYEPGHTRGQVPELAFRVSCLGGYDRMAQDATRQQPVSNLYQKTSQLLERIGAYFRGYLPLRSDDGVGPQYSSQRRHCSRKTASAASGEATAGNWRRHWLSRSCGWLSFETPGYILI
jgi:hypothetical protein